VESKPIHSHRENYSGEGVTYDTKKRNRRADNEAFAGYIADNGLDN
jgi:hypothetical protein